MGVTLRGLSPEGSRVRRVIMCRFTRDASALKRLSMTAGT